MNAAYRVGAFCHRCVHRAACNGPCPCLLTGRNIIDHATADDCPIAWDIAHAAEYPVVYVTLSPSPPPAPKAVQPIPRSEWPEHINALADMAEPGDAGIGDVIERLLSTGGIVFKMLAKKAWGSCGCGRRRDSLNAAYKL